MAILDTDFLSSFFKIQKLKLILRVLNVKQFAIPSTVYEELKDAPFFNQISSFFAFNETELNEDRFILIKSVDLIKSKLNFTTEELTVLGKGELGCFKLAKDSGDIILIDDQRARVIAKRKNLKVVSIPTFLLFCKMKNFLSLDDIQRIVKELNEKDYYVISEEGRELLFR